jgi:hypothetical protein
MSTDRIIRTARKRHRCVNAHAADVGNPAVADICTRYIEPGQLYVEGEVDPYVAGGFGHDYICKPCSDAGQA